MGKTVSYAALLALSAGVMMAPTAVAEDSSFSANVALTSDYVWRGVTQNSGNPAIQGGFDFSQDLFYIGTWASIVDFGGANMELDVYGGFAGETESGVSWDVGAIGYFYPDTDDLDFVEFYGGLGYETEAGLAMGATAYFDVENESVYVEASAGYGFTDALSGDVSVGKYDFDGDGDYTAFSLGATYSFDAVDVDLRLWGNDIDETGVPAEDDLLEERLVLTVSKSFP